MESIPYCCADVDTENTVGSEKEKKKSLAPVVVYEFALAVAGANQANDARAKKIHQPLRKWRRGILTTG
jgi:hypothetical protein